jgi:serine/threonine protein kinase
MREMSLPDPKVDELRAEQLARWEKGDRVRLEVLLPTRAGLSDDTEAVLDLIYGEILLREEHGDLPQRDEYLRRFPHLADPLRRLFGVHEGLRSLETDDPNNKDAGVTTITDAGASDECAFRGQGMPRQIGPYEILEEIGRGGMGIVWKARHRLTGRLAAVKVLRSEDASEEERARFLNEARAVAALSHPNIVQIYEVSAPPEGEGVTFVALEYGAGGNLAAHIDGTPLPPREAAVLLQALADAMAHAHEAGIIHRDLKPANVLLASGACQRPEGTPQTSGGLHPPLAVMPKITDFGIAKALDVHSGQTRTGSVLGTPSYMAPEQAMGRTAQVGPLSDIYALGAILYEMLTGRPPFKGTTVLDTLDQVRSQEPVAPRKLNPNVCVDLETICLKCLHKEPARRFTSSRELAHDLMRYINGEPIRARPVGTMERGLKWIRRRPAAAALLAVTALAVAALVAVWASFTILLQEQRREAITQRDRAEKQASIARDQTVEARKQSERASHLLALTATAVDKIAVSARGSRTEGAGSRDAGSVLFKLASFYARASRTLATDEVLPADDRRRLGEQYAVSAVRLLNCAEKVGFFSRTRKENLSTLDRDLDLASLRDRADYRQFRERLR